MIVRDTDRMIVVEKFGDIYPLSPSVNKVAKIDIEGCFVNCRQERVGSKNLRCRSQLKLKTWTTIERQELKRFTAFSHPSNSHTYVSTASINTRCPKGSIMWLLRKVRCML